MSIFTVSGYMFGGGARTVSRNHSGSTKISGAKNARPQIISNAAKAAKLASPWLESLKVRFNLPVVFESASKAFFRTAELNLLKNPTNLADTKNRINVWNIVDSPTLVRKHETSETR
jgi:hypothetical protein